MCCAWMMLSPSTLRLKRFWLRIHTTFSFMRTQAQSGSMFATTIPEKKKGEIFEYVAFPIHASTILIQEKKHHPSHICCARMMLPSIPEWNGSDSHTYSWKSLVTVGMNTYIMLSPSTLRPPKVELDLHGETCRCCCWHRNPNNCTTSLSIYSSGDMMCCDFRGDQDVRAKKDTSPIRKQCLHQPFQRRWRAYSFHEWCFPHRTSTYIAWKTNACTIHSWWYVVRLIEMMGYKVPWMLFSPSMLCER